jgi:hypothetical protein
MNLGLRNHTIDAMQSVARSRQKITDLDWRVRISISMFAEMEEVSVGV